LLAKKIGLGAKAAVVNRLTAGLDNMHYTLACDKFDVQDALRASYTMQIATKR
jgi:hypothetical protein